MKAATGSQELARRLDLTRGLRTGHRLLARFGAVGLLAFVVDVGTFNLVRHLLELGPLTSKTVAVVVATTVAFLGNLSWTFDARRGNRRPAAAYVLFFTANGVALLISLACLGISYYALGLTSALAENVSTNVVGVGLGTAFRFWAYQRWVFPAVPVQQAIGLVRPERVPVAAGGRHRREVA